MQSRHQKTIQELGPWFHNVHLPDGTCTCPEHPYGDFPSYKWLEIANVLPKNLSGWTALDIGCNAGFYSVELAKRGAKVTAIDVDAHYLDQARWFAAQWGVGSSIDFRQMQVYDLAREPDRYDLVLFMGVLYHLRYPMLALDIVAQKVRRLMVFQGLTTLQDGADEAVDDADLVHRSLLSGENWPKLSFIEHSFCHDPTNWWVPNIPCVRAMLRSAGLRIACQPGEETFIAEPNPEQPSCVTTWDRFEYESAVGHLGSSSLR